MATPRERMQERLRFIYGEETARTVWPRLAALLDAYRARHPEWRAKVLPPEERLTERDALVITYADQIQREGEPPLRTLSRLFPDLLTPEINWVHLLPFYPYSSDDGFSVIDYKAVNLEFGTWEDVARFRPRMRLMFDAVINHISSQSAWFQAFLRGEPPYRDFFIVVDPHTDLSQVVRPRTTPLLTPFQTVDGVKYVWTTFSADQIDLNYANPEVLLAVLDVLLFYVEQGAELIRLDAIAFLWKEIGTPCIHHPKTHAIVKLFRDVLDEVAPNVMLITETNVPHAENISYFGNGYDEAQLVYNFALPPLVLHTFAVQSAAQLSAWAATLQTPSPATTFFNFLASHDGIGVRPVESILSLDEIDALVERTLAHGGRVSYRALPNGGQSPYELNVTYFDALNDPAHPSPLDVPRFLAAHAIMLSLAGIPAIYVHSLFGSRNCQRCVEERGYNRAINREKFEYEHFMRALNDPRGLRRQVFDGLHRLLAVRRTLPAFHPTAAQEVVMLDESVFALVRHPRDGVSAPVLVLVNVTPAPCGVDVPVSLLGAGLWRDLLSEASVLADGITQTVELTPYAVQWWTV
nr:alpha-amylase family glycosyl hydrolase [Ardenticatena sp.]